MQTKKSCAAAEAYSYQQRIEKENYSILRSRKSFCPRHSKALQSYLNLLIRQQTNGCREQEREEAAENSFSYPGKWKHKRLICFWYFISLNFKMYNFLLASSTVYWSLFCSNSFCYKKNIIKSFRFIFLLAFCKIFMLLEIFCLYNLIPFLFEHNFLRFEQLLMTSSCSENKKHAFPPTSC